ncbi:MAG: SDR family oxidoreductase [Christensenellales bacterium]|jgi:nucleoside-diphosphate-sugar epimerase
MEVYITGITGKTGRHLLKHLEENRELCGTWRFFVSVREKSDVAALDASPLAIEKCYGDLKDSGYARRFLGSGESGAEKVLLHIASIDYTLPLAEAAIENGFSRLILVHTTGIYSKYKAAGERKRNIEHSLREMLEGKNISLSILRPTMIYGTTNDQNIAVFLRMVDVLRLFPVIGGAKYKLQPVWCGDLGWAYGEILLHPEKTLGKDYILSGAEPILLIDVLKILSEYLGKRTVFFNVPFRFAYFGAVSLYHVARLFGKKADFREKVQRLCEDRDFPHDEAARDFGFSPVGFREGVKEEVEMYIQEKKKGRRSHNKL